MAESEERPLVTFIVLAYNQERFIEEAVSAAFAQDYSPLEIILSDDCSTDTTFDIMSRMAGEYSGPHIIRLNRNQPNLNIPGHVNRVIELAQGELVVLAAGDDISRPDRTSLLAAAWLKDDRLTDCVFSNCNDVDESGKFIQHRKVWRDIFDDLPSVARYGAVILGAPCAWTKRLFLKWGGLRTDLTAEDSTLTVRALLSGGVSYVDDYLVDYRRSNSSWLYRGARQISFRDKGKRLAEVSLANALSVLKDFETHADPKYLELACLRVRDARIVSDLYAKKSLIFSAAYHVLFGGMNFRNLLVHTYYLYVADIISAFRLKLAGPHA